MDQVLEDYLYYIWLGGRRSIQDYENRWIVGFKPEMEDEAINGRAKSSRLR